MPLISLGYKRIHYTDYKPDSGQTREVFILTHGLGSSQNYYTPLIPSLLKENFRCITFDTTGAARSPYTYIEQTISSLSHDVIKLLDYLKVEKAIVVGHSMGGIVAANLAIKYPERIVASIWIGPVYPSEGVREIFEKRIATVEQKGMESMANMIPDVATGKKASPLMKAFIRELLLNQTPEGYVSNCRVIANAEVPAYEKIQCPVLVLAGDEDKSAPLEGCERMFEQLGTEEKKMIVLECGHWHCVEAPEEVANKVLGFYHEIQ